MYEENEQQIFDSRLGQNDPIEQVILTKSDEVNLTQWTGQFDQTNNHRLPNIEKDSFVHSENFGKKIEEIHVAGEDCTYQTKTQPLLLKKAIPLLLKKAIPLLLKKAKVIIQVLIIQVLILKY